ncbi:hypothetical protein AB0B15_02930 [Streptomyces sp. NPDC045456]|uniref:hypothetical protein n=1 Tax=Streptomyces sp. NPDC045456 TaxID=3155254 RepID=UPI0033F1EFA8
MPRRYDGQGYVIVRDNSDRCRDCGGDKQNICYQDEDPNTLKVMAVYCLCMDCDRGR